MIDASAILAVVMGEDDMDVYAEALASDYGNLFVSPFNLFEAWTRVDRLPNEERRNTMSEFEKMFPMQLIHTDLRQLRFARRARRQYGKGTGNPANLNMGDCFAYALAKAIGEPLLFKGDDFTHTDMRSAL